MILFIFTAFLLLSRYALEISSYDSDFTLALFSSGLILALSSSFIQDLRNFLLVVFLCGQHVFLIHLYFT